MSDDKITYKGGQSITQLPPKRKHMWWRYLLVWMSGILTAGIVTGAVIGITGGVLTTKEVITMFGGNPSDILKEDYQNKSILDLVSSLANTKFETLGDIDKVTPIAKKILDESINPILDKELHFQYDWEILKIKPFSLPASDRPIEEVDPDEDLSTYIGRAIKEEVTLASFVGESAPHMMDLFLYPKDEEGEFDYEHPYTLSTYINASSEFFDDIVSNIHIKDVVEIGEGDKLMNAIADWAINDFNQEKVNTLSVGLFLDSESENPLIQRLSQFTIGELTEENLKSLKISELVTINENTPKIIKALADLEYTIGDLESTNLYSVLKVSDVFETEGNTFLTAIKDKYLSDLEDQDTIMNLKLNEVFNAEEGSSSIVIRFGEKTLAEITADGFLSGMMITEAFSEEEIANNILLTALVRDNPEVKMSDLSDFDTIQNLYISDVITEEQYQDNLILSALVEDGVQIKNLGSAIDNLTLGQILEIDSGSNKLLQTLAETKINELNSKLNDLTVGDVMEIEEGSYLDHDEIKNASINDLDGLMTALKNNLKLKDVIDIVYEGENKSPQILIELANTKLVDLDEQINQLKLNQLIVIDESSHPILQALSNISILDEDAFNQRLNNLMLCDVYTRDDCSGVLETIWDNNSDGHILISDLPSAMNDLTLVELLEDTIYVEGDTRVIGEVTYKRVTNTWWYLLTEEGETFTEQEKYYVLKNGLSYKLGSDMDKIVTNFNYHMNHESIRELHNAEFINIDSDNLAKLDYYVTYQGVTKKIGDMTISEFVNYCLALVTAA